MPAFNGLISERNALQIAVTLPRVYIKDVGRVETFFSCFVCVGKFRQKFFFFVREVIGRKYLSQSFIGKDWRKVVHRKSPCKSRGSSVYVEGGFSFVVIANQDYRYDLQYYHDEYHAKSR